MAEDMMDGILRQLRSVPLDGSLDGLDDRVMAALAVQRREARATQRATALAAVISLMVGGVAGISMTEPAAARPLSPLAPVTALAPSSLLDMR